MLLVEHKVQFEVGSKALFNLRPHGNVIANILHQLEKTPRGKWRYRGRVPRASDSGGIHQLRPILFLLLFFFCPLLRHVVVIDGNGQIAIIHPRHPYDGILAAAEDGITGIPQGRHVQGFAHNVGIVVQRRHDGVQRRRRENFREEPVHVHSDPDLPRADIALRLLLVTHGPRHGVRRHEGHFVQVRGMAEIQQRCEDALGIGGNAAQSSVQGCRPSLGPIGDLGAFMWLLLCLFPPGGGFANEPRQEAGYGDVPFVDHASFSCYVVIIVARSQRLPQKSSVLRIPTLPQRRRLLHLVPRLDNLFRSLRQLLPPVPRRPGTGWIPLEILLGHGFHHGLLFGHAAGEFVVFR
mmetsp:Transcript_13276/g.28172  ORF Transcript_13276/g.28172 Transcript_13276/m.28172 type:complete len:351 (+) Transcript_13276:1616-2668(+)